LSQLQTLWHCKSYICWPR